MIFKQTENSENLGHRFILCKLRWKLRVRRKFDWQVLEYLVQRLLNIKIFKIYFLVLIFNNKPLDEQIKDFQIILITYNTLQQQTDQIKESNLPHQTTN